MIHWIELHPYWSVLLSVWIIGLAIVVWYIKTAEMVDENEHLIDKKIIEQDIKYH